MLKLTTGSLLSLKKYRESHQDNPIFSLFLLQTFVGFLETVLQKNIHAVINAAAQALKIGKPVQIVSADRKISTGRNAIGDIKSLLSGAPAIGKSAVNRVVGRKPRIDRQVARNFQAEFRPAAASAYFTTVCRVDALTAAAAHIAHIAAPPTFAAQ